jgi:hypothetical protein
MTEPTQEVEQNILPPAPVTRKAADMLSEPFLTPSQIALRDGVAVKQTNPAVLERRQDQIRALESEIAEAQDLLAEFERFQVFAQDAPVSRRTMNTIDYILDDKKGRIKDAIYHKQTDLRALRTRLGS